MPTLAAEESPTTYRLINGAFPSTLPSTTPFGRKSSFFGGTYPQALSQVDRIEKPGNEG